MTITHDDNNKLAQLQLARNNAINAYQRACSPAWDDPPLEPDDAAILLYRITVADATYIRALLAERERLLAENARLREALKPFALTDDERCELGSFLDDEDVYMRPDDGNDSVKNGWRKQVTIGNLRHAWYVLRAAAPASQRDGE